MPDAITSDDLQEEFFDAMAEGDDDCDSVNGDQDEVDNITLGMCTWIVFCAFLCLFLRGDVPSYSCFSLPPSEEQVLVVSDNDLFKLAVSAGALLDTVGDNTGPKVLCEDLYDVPYEDLNIGRLYDNGLLTRKGIIPFSEGIAAWRDDLTPSGSGSSPPGRGRGGGSGKCAHGVSYRASDDVCGADCEGGRGCEVDGGGGGKVTSPCCGLAAWILEPRGRRCVVAEVGSQFALACGVDRARGLSRHATRRRVSVDSGEMVHDDFGPQHLHDGPIFRVSVR